MDKKEAARIRTQNQRKRDIEKMSQTENVIQSVTNMEEMSHQDVTHEHPIMKYLIPGEKREDMEAIVLSLKKFNVLDKVDLGFVPMTIVADYLEATAK